MAFAPGVAVQVGDGGKGVFVCTGVTFGNAVGVGVGAVVHVGDGTTVGVLVGRSSVVLSGAKVTVGAARVLVGVLPGVASTVLSGSGVLLGITFVVVCGAGVLIGGMAVGVNVGNGVAVAGGILSTSRARTPPRKFATGSPPRPNAKRISRLPSRLVNSQRPSWYSPGVSRLL